MAKKSNRVRVIDAAGHGSDIYGIVKEVSDIKYIRTGSVLLDAALGGGYPRGRLVNIVGDSSTGKTLMAIEATANYHIEYPKGKIDYAETESAFDHGYAGRIGLPEDAVNFPDKPDTIEQFYKALNSFCDSIKHADGGLYILDSLDGVSDEAEMGREMGESTYGTGKAKGLSEMFRRIVRKLERKNVTLMIISQVRENIGVTFGDKLKRSGGKALQFYSSQVIWLANVGKIKCKRRGIERTIGNDVRMVAKKNKCAEAFRPVDVPILFSYGMDDVSASVNFICKSGYGDHLKIGNTEKAANEYLKSLTSLTDEEYNEVKDQVAKVTVWVWDEVEKLFRPQRKKYA